MRPAELVLRNIISTHLVRYQASQRDASKRRPTERDYVAGITAELNEWLKANGYRGVTLHDVRKAETFACGSFSYVSDFAAQLSNTITPA